MLAIELLSMPRSNIYATKQRRVSPPQVKLINASEIVYAGGIVATTPHNGDAKQMEK